MVFCEKLNANITPKHCATRVQAIVVGHHILKTDAVFGLSAMSTATANLPKR